MKLLLAEDEKALSDAIVTILRHSNYTVDAVYNGEDALDYLQGANYDCAILDVMMPKMDGITVLKNYRNQGGKIPVIILTAKSEIDDKVVGLDCGADDYITKPFNTKEFLARIRAMTRRQSEVAGNEISFGDLQLDRVAFELSTTSGKMLLTSKEFQLMEMLMLNPRQLFSIDIIMEKIWGFDSETEINVIWTYVSYLRKKLKMLDSKVILKGVRNIGYTLEYNG